jgi:hypothetical protein
VATKVIDDEGLTGPLMLDNMETLATTLGFTVTLTGEEVTEHPAPLVARTV